MIARSLARGGLALLIAAAVLFVAAASARATEDGHVTVDNFTFAPATLTVHAGATVTFENHDDIPHSVVAADNSFRLKVMDTGETRTETFPQAGTFAYYCGLHPHMKGTIIVVP